MRLPMWGMAVWAAIVLGTIAAGEAVAEGEGELETQEASQEVQGAGEVVSQGAGQGAEGEGVDYFSLDRLDAYLELEADFDSSRVRSRRGSAARGNGVWGPLGSWLGGASGSGRETQVNRDLGFEERLGLSFDATFLGADVARASGEVSFALTQDRYRERDRYGSRTESDSGFLLEYDARMELFSGKPLSGSVYGLRREDRINRRFQPTLDEDRTGFGTSWRMVHGRHELDLTYDYLETDRTGSRSEFDNEHFTESVLHGSWSWAISSRHRLAVSYEHAESRQSYQGLGLPFATTRDLVTIEDEISFGEKGRHTFRTLVHWQEESGDYARDFFQIGPQLTLRHSEDFQTMYKYQFNRERYEGLDIETHRADWQAVHQVYRNLTTTVNVFGLYEEVNQDVDTMQYGGSVDWQYRRKNRLGSFHGNLSLSFDRSHVQGHDGPRVVLDESATMRDPVPVRLRNRFVQPGSVLVTDATNRRVYVQGVDYLVVQTREVTRVSRVVTGRIADGDTVLIDYRYEVPGRGRQDTMRVDFGIEQRFSGFSDRWEGVNGLTPYYRLGYRNQEADRGSRFVTIGAGRTNHHRLGVTYERPRYTLGAEFELFDDTVEPYDAFHVDGLWHVPSRAAGRNHVAPEIHESPGQRHDARLVRNAQQRSLRRILSCAAISASSPAP